MKDFAKKNLKQSSLARQLILQEPDKMQRDVAIAKAFLYVDMIKKELNV